MLDQTELIQYLSHYAYEPIWVYSIIILMLTLSSFGLPLPEEVTLISAGAIAYFGQHPGLYHPPFEGAEPIRPETVALVCFIAVFGSDSIVYFLGRMGRRWLKASTRLARFTEHAAYRKSEQLIQKHGAWMAGAFRFTPGLRFPGHLACGMMGLQFRKFAAIDGTAALVSVPTQVLLVAYYGEEIVSLFKDFKLLVVVLLLIVVFVHFRRRRLART